ncbi:hypothetical protein ACFO3J_23655 [Streptomyces polygonati]|uniref:Uncharacterized protein n=1 Tax=Streptomyces polygonati TaxID=1617087 RepID=A0ABV8HU82_9ACTN
MAFTGLDPERVARLSVLVAELRPMLERGTDMPVIQQMLSARGIGVMDSIIVTRELLGAGPEALGQAKTLVLTRPGHQVEREIHRALVEEPTLAINRINHEN